MQLWRAGVDMAGLGANAAVSLKLEAVKKAVQKKSDTPPPHERQSSPVCLISTQPWRIAHVESHYFTRQLLI